MQKGLKMLRVEVILGDMMSFLCFLEYTFYTAWPDKKSSRTVIAFYFGLITPEILTIDTT